MILFFIRLYNTNKKKSLNDYLLKSTKFTFKCVYKLSMIWNGAPVESTVARHKWHLNAHRLFSKASHSAIKRRQDRDRHLCAIN